MSIPVEAHYNLEHSGHPRHIFQYLFPHKSDDADEACDLIVTNTTYVSGEVKVWEGDSDGQYLYCFVTNNSGFTNNLLPSGTYAPAKHCDYDEYFVQDGGTCELDLNNVCAIHKNSTIQRDDWEAEFDDFNVPDEDELNGTFWEPFKGCHFKQVTSAPTSNPEYPNCFNTTYAATGGVTIDHDHTNEKPILTAPTVPIEIPSTCGCPEDQTDDGYGGCISTNGEGIPVIPDPTGGESDPFYVDNSDLIDNETDLVAAQNAIENDLLTSSDTALNDMGDEYIDSLDDDFDVMNESDVSGIGNILESFVPQYQSCNSLTIDIGPNDFNLDCTKVEFFKSLFAYVIYFYTIYHLFFIMVTPIESRV